MSDRAEEIQIRLKYVDELLSRLENREGVSVLAILQDEISALRALSEKHRAERENKRVIRREERLAKTRYYLKDGSVYVVKGREYRYLYDSQSKTVTYEFENGQVERTFEHGLKEIRQSDGGIVIKNGAKDYDYIGP